MGIGISRRTRGDRHSSRVEAKNPALLSNRDGYLLELTGWTQGSQPSEAFGERSRDWSLGHAGDEGPHLSMTGESRGCSRAAALVCGFSRGTTARSVSLSWGAREVGSPRSEEHTSELQSPTNLVCRLLLEKKKEVIGQRE